MGRKKFKNRGLNMQPPNYDNNDYKLNTDDEENLTNEEELYALYGKVSKEKKQIKTVKDFFKASWYAIKEWMPILWDAIVYEFKTASKMQIIMCIILIIVIVKITGMNSSNKTDEPIYTMKKSTGSTQFEREAKIEQSKKRYAQFRNMDKRLLLYKVFELCGEWRYQSGGNNAFGSGDCVALCDISLQYFGSLAPRENVSGRYNRLEKLRAIGATIRITNPWQLKAGDIIIFRNGDNFYHEALVYDYTPTGQLRYLEMGGAASIASLSMISFNDPRIIIYQNSIEFWLGDAK